MCVVLLTLLLVLATQSSDVIAARVHEQRRMRAATSREATLLRKTTAKKRDSTRRENVPSDQCFYGGTTCQECLALDDSCAWCNAMSNATGNAVGRCVSVREGRRILDEHGSPSDPYMVLTNPAETCTNFILTSSKDTCDGGGESVRKELSAVVEEEEDHVPSNDAECLWDYSAAKCEYSEVCEYRFRFGDLTLSQSCRLKTSDSGDHTPTTDAECHWSYGGAHCDNSDVCEYHYKFGDLTLGQSCRLRTAKKPTSDQECSWDVGKAACAWPEVCEYRYELGDMNLGQSCRLIAQTAPASDDDCKWDYAHAECALPQFCEYHFWVGDMTLDSSCVMIGSRDSDDGATPTSDEDCSWDYKDATCAWSDVCSYQYHFGDITLGDSCRLTATAAQKTKYTGEEPKRDGDCDWDFSDAHCAWPDVCSFQFHTGDISLDASCRMTKRTTKTLSASMGGENVTDTPGESGVTPASDEDCKWDGGENRCKWPEHCFYKMCAGDVTFGQSCRLRKNWMNRTCNQDPHAKPPIDDSGCSWDYGNGKCKFPGICQYHFCFGDGSLDDSCRFAVEDRSCNSTKYAHLTGLPDQPVSNDECEWDYAMGECTHLEHCEYHYCAGDATLSQSCRLRSSKDKCVTDEERAEQFENEQERDRMKRLEAARIKRLRIEKRASEEKATWNRVLEMVRKEEIRRKMDEGAASYERQLDAVGWAEKAAVLDRKAAWPSILNDDVADAVDGSAAISATRTRVDSTQTPVGVVAEQSRRQALERMCRTAKCAKHGIGRSLWNDCMEECLFSGKK